MPTKKKSTKKATKKAVKKTTRKTTNKTAKTAGRSKKTAKTLVYATNGESFWVKDGQILNSLTALRDALDLMSADVYKYHAQNDNDFARWVEVVLCDADCAKALRKTKSPKGARTAVVKHLKLYTV